MKTKNPKITVVYGTKPSKSAKAKNGKNHFVEVCVDGKIDKSLGHEFYHSRSNCRRGAHRIAKRFNVKAKKA